MCQMIICLIYLENNLDIFTVKPSATIQVQILFVDSEVKLITRSNTHIS